MIIKKMTIVQKFSDKEPFYTIGTFSNIYEAMHSATGWIDALAAHGAGLPMTITIDFEALADDEEL